MRNPLAPLLNRGRDIVARFRRPATAPAVPLLHDQAMVHNLNGSRWPSWIQFSYIFRYLNKREGWIFRGAIVLLFGSAIFLVGRYIDRHWIAEPAVGGSFTEAVVGAPRFINPVLASSDVDLAMTPLLYSGLLRQLPDGTFANDLAENVAVSADGKTYTVKLAQGRTWHDGQPLTADDVSFTVETIQNPNVASPRYADFRDMKVDAPDDRTITFTLEKANPGFRRLLTQGILPAHIWAEIPPASMTTTDYNLKPIGNGPFKFKEIRKKERSGDVTNIILERNAAAANPAFLQELKIRFVDDGQAALDSLGGQADGTRLVNNELYVKAEKLRGGRVDYLFLPQSVAAFFNTKRSLFASKDVRLALRDAIDPASVRDAARPSAQTIASPVLQGMLGWSALPERKADLEGARQRLEKAGWKKEGDVYVKAKTKLAFTLTVPDVKEYVDAANALAAAWKNLGATVTVSAVDPSTLAKEVIKERAFDILLFADRYDATLDLYPFWHSTQSFDPGLNLTSFYSKDMDAALDKAHAGNTLDADRTAANTRVQQIMVEEAPAIFLYQPAAAIVRTKTLRSTNPPTLLTASNRFLDVSNWYVDTDRTWQWNP
ncbi:MAG: ABC transporter substrate-binding protein [Patescibacteria group bacterium]